MTRRPLLLALCAALALQPLAGGLASAQEPTPASLRLKWLPQAQFAGFYTALEKGYYEEEGIALTINPGGPNILTENLVATGADTFGLSGGTDSVFAARDRGLPIVCIGVAHQVTPFVFVTAGDGPVETVQDFAGKTVTTWFTGANHVLSAMLAHEGVDLGTVDMQPQQVSMTPFVDGEVDVATATRYNELYTVNTRLGAENVRLFVPEDFGVSFPRDTLIVSERTLADDPELVAGFLRASIRGWQDAFADPEGAIDTIMAVAPTLDRAHQEFMLEEVRELMTAGQAGEDGLFAIDPAAIGSAHDLLVEYGVLSAPVDLDAAFDASALEAIPLEDRAL
ncbi:ABC transporter substrate-binding protein [Aureimonas populi]|uniref:Thiamine pyrimidine synthase n=1 Tax=Aureimonas populi TaxID=1701758 RepID=A0ABW5CRH9_9HYPH|nr:ABC transporter substrate-binding protein [Aureimonas populi]